MKILHVIPSIDFSQGGPSRTVVHLVNGLAKNSQATIFLYTYECLTGNQLSLNSSVVPLIQKTSDSSFLSTIWYQDFKKIRYIIQTKKIDLIHIHGAWHPLFHWAARAAVVENIPYIIQPRGMLEPWSLNFRKFKKKLALIFYQKVDLRVASGFIATANQEACSISDLCQSDKIVIIPNGVEPAIPVTVVNDKDGTKTALFMSRIHPKKGIFELIRAWASLRPSNWVLRVVGPDDGQYFTQVRELISKLGLDDCVQAVGPKYGEDRGLEYSRADVFILPTYSENFGVVVAEALSYGIPVLTTTGAPWSSLAENKCGWWIEPGEKSLREVLPEVLSISKEERASMGVRAKTLAALFDWDNVAKQTFDFYLKVLASHKITK